MSSFGTIKRCAPLTLWTGRAIRAVKHRAVNTNYITMTIRDIMIVRDHASGD